MTPPIPVAKGQSLHSILPRMANRHGLVAGATGTGKTVTLRVLAERFSSMGVPVFAADVKGDLSGLALAGAADPRLQERADSLGIAGFSGRACPTILWDVFGEQGHPVRTTISEMGPILLARLLDLNEVQSGVLSLVFRIADEEGLLLLDLKDLRAMLRHAADNAERYGAEFGNISPASVGAIQRSLLALEDEGAAALFGEPALRLTDFLRVDGDGRGFVNLLAADRLIRSPRLYATFLLWLLAELFEQLPEVGDPEKPRLVFFFDEAHLLFDEAPKVLQDRIEQVVRLVRSKGVGVYFVSQSPLDIPDDVLGQLGHRVQHALRAFTPRDRKALKACAETFRAAPGLELESAISELGVGEAIVSFLDAEGRPEPADRCRIAPPGSRLAPLSPAERADVLANSPVAGRYEQAVDRESAYELLQGRAAESSAPHDDDPPHPSLPSESDSRRTARPAAGSGGELLGALAESAARAVGSQIGRQLVRGLLGSLLGPTPRRRRR